jgi:hypothetical protein
MSAGRDAGLRMSSIAWAIAASDLGVRLTTPYSLRDRFGIPLEFIAHVEDFGASSGTLVWYMPEPIPSARLPLRAAHFVSAVNPVIYSEYDRDRYIALLNGWGWTGQGDPPGWYEGIRE